MGGGGPDDGIGARRVGARSSVAGPGTALAPWQVGVGQEGMEGETGLTREASEQHPNPCPSSYPELPHWAGRDRRSSRRGSTFVITFANFPGGPVPSGRSRWWSSQGAFEARSIHCGEGEAGTTHSSRVYLGIGVLPGTVTSVYPGSGT